MSNQDGPAAMPPDGISKPQMQPTEFANVALRIGIARGAFELPDDIDTDNAAIAALFGTELLD
jgi:hypothetical protein